jgi:hypothetical protein
VNIVAQRDKVERRVPKDDLQRLAKALSGQVVFKVPTRLDWKRDSAWAGQAVRFGHLQIVQNWRPTTPRRAYLQLLLSSKNGINLLTHIQNLNPSCSLDETSFQRTLGGEIRQISRT